MGMGGRARSPSFSRDALASPFLSTMVGPSWFVAHSKVTTYQNTLCYIYIWLTVDKLFSVHHLN